MYKRQYYGRNSYNKWIRVGWSLRNQSDRLFLTWVAFSAKSPDFRYSDISDLLDRWSRFDDNNEHGLTKRSIIYWAKQDAPKTQFKQVQHDSIEYYVDQTLNVMLQSDFNSKISGCTDFDLAYVLYQMYKDEYICVGVKNNVWYQYRNHRWIESDSGTQLRKSISENMRRIYVNKLNLSLIHI